MRATAWHLIAWVFNQTHFLSYLFAHNCNTGTHTHTRNTQWLSDDTINPTCLSPFLSHTHAHNHTEACANHLPGSFCTSSVGNPINFHSREQHNETHPRLPWLALSHTHTHARARVQVYTYCMLWVTEHKHKAAEWTSTLTIFCQIIKIPE